MKNSGRVPFKRYQIFILSFKAILHLFLVLNLFQGRIYASGSVEDSISPEKAKIGDVIQYKAKKNNSLEWVYPKEGIHSRPGEIVPWVEIIKIEELEDNLIVQLSYFQSGVQSVPIGWKESTLPNSEIQYSDKTIEIQSTLTGEEEDLYDIQPPIDFVGFSWKRLLYWMIGIGIFAIFGFFLYKKWKKRQKVYDAEFRELEVPQIDLSQFTHPIDKLLQQDKISSKELAQFISTYLKAKVQAKKHRDISHLTDEEMLSFFPDLFPDQRIEFPEKIQLIRKWKFSDQEIFLNPDEAKDLYLFFKKTI